MRDRADAANPGRNPDGTPTLDNPTFSLSTPGAAPIGVPNFFIDKFRIPPFLLPIYQAAGIEYGMRWEVLAAINEIETDYGRNLNVSSAGALGWMQFMPATWKMYGVDANQRRQEGPVQPGRRDLRRRALPERRRRRQDLRSAIFAYNHADWYVDSVLLRARVIGGLPADLVGSLTGLTQGRFPVHAKATYADDLSERDESRSASRKGQNAAVVGRVRRRRAAAIKHLRRSGAPVVAVNDGRDHRDRHEQAPRPLRQAPGRLRQHVHVRAPRQGRQALPGAEGDARSPSARSQQELELPRRTAAAAEAAARRPRPRARRSRPRVRKASPPRRSRRRRRRAHRADRQGRQGAPVRQPARARTRPTPAATSSSSSARRRIDGVSTFQGYLTRVYGLDRSGRRAQAAQDGLAASSPARSSAASARPSAELGPARRCSRSARPAAAPRGSTRSRSSTAGSCSSRPRSTAPRARTRSSAPTPTRPRSARSC